MTDIDYGPHKVPEDSYHEPFPDIWKEKFRKLDELRSKQPILPELKNPEAKGRKRWQRKSDIIRFHSPCGF